MAAVLAEQGSNPAKATHAVKELTEWVNQPDWQQILPAYARCVRITRDQTETFRVEESAFEEKAEKDLFAAIRAMETSSRSRGSVNDVLKAFEPHIPVINTFFEKVMVMSEDAGLRENRLGLLQRIAGTGIRCSGSEPVGRILILLNFSTFQKPIWSGEEI